LNKTESYGLLRIYAAVWRERHREAADAAADAADAAAWREWDRRAAADAETAAVRASATNGSVSYEGNVTQGPWRWAP
jgi:hypothetical protein